MQSTKIDRRLLTILLIVFVQMLGAAMILPILPLFAKNEFDLPVAYIPWLGTTFFIAQFFAGPFLGRLSDRFGRVPVLITSQIGTVLSFLMLGLAPNAGILFLARLLDGITGGNIIVAQAYIADITPPERKTESFGYTMAAFGMGFIIGPAIGGGLAAAFGPRIPYFMAAVAASVVVLLTFFTLNETVDDEQKSAAASQSREGINWGAIFGSRVIVVILLIAFTTQMILGVLQSTLALFAEAVIWPELSESRLNAQLGILFATVGITQVITQAFLIRKLLPRLGEVGMMLVGAGLLAIAQLLMANATNFFFAGTSAILFASGLGFIIPSIQSLASSSAGKELQGQILGVVQSASNLGVIVSGLVSGFLFAMMPALPYWISFVLALLLYLPAYFLFQKLGAKPTPVPA